MVTQQALIQQQRQALVSAQQQAKGLAQAQQIKKSQLLAKQRGIAGIAQIKAAAQLRKEAGRQQIVRVGQQAAQFETEVAQKAPEYAKPGFKEKAYQEAKQVLQSKASSLQKAIDRKSTALQKERSRDLRDDEWIDETKDEINILQKELGVYSGTLKGSKEAIIKGYYSGKTSAQADYERQKMEASYERSEQKKAFAKQQGFTSFFEYRKAYKEYKETLPPTKVPGVIEPAKIIQAPGTYDPSTRVYISPEGYGQTMLPGYEPPVGAKIIKPSLPSFLVPPKLPWEKPEVSLPMTIIEPTPSFLQPVYETPAQRQFMESLTKPYQVEVKRYQQLGYKPTEARKLATESLRVGGITFDPTAVEKIVRKIPTEFKKPEITYVPEVKPKGVEQLGQIFLKPEEIEARAVQLAEPSIVSRLFEEKETQKRFEQSWKEYQTTVPEEGYRLLTKKEYELEVLPQIVEQVKLEKVGGYGILVPEEKGFIEKQKETWVIGEKLVSEKIPTIREVAKPISEFILKHKEFTPEEIEKLEKVERVIRPFGEVGVGIYKAVREKPVTVVATTVAFTGVAPAISAVGLGARATGVTALLAKVPTITKVGKVAVKAGVYGLSAWYGSTVIQRVMAADDPEKAYKEYKKIVKEEGIPEGYRELDKSEFKAQYKSISKGETLGRIIGGEIVPMGLGGYLGTRIISKPRITKTDIKAIQKAKPDVFVGRGVGDKFEVISKRRTPKLEVQTIQEFEVIRETGQIVRGKGTQRIIDIKTGREVVTPESFTFFGESEKAKAFRTKIKRILEEKKPIKLDVSAGRVRILTKDLKKIDKAFAGLAKQKGKFIQVITGETPVGRYYKTDKTGMILSKVGKPLEYPFYEDVLTSRFKPTGFGLIKLMEPKVDVKPIKVIKPPKVKPTSIGIEPSKVKPTFIEMKPPKVKPQMIEIKKPVFEAPSLVGVAVEEEIISIIKPTPKPSMVKVTKPVILDVVPEPILKPIKELIIKPPIKKVEPIVTTQILEPMVEVKPITMREMKLAEIQAMKLAEIKAVKLVEIEAMKPVEAQLLRPAMVQAMRPAMVQRLRPVSRLAPRITPEVIVRPRPPVGPPKLVPKLLPRRTRFVKHLEKRKLLKSGYGIEIRRRGKWERVHLPKSFATKEGADAFAMAMVQREAAASYKLVKSKKPARKSFRKPSALQKFMFRPGKEAGVMVQKKLLRITTPGEVKEISLVGAAARRKKPRNVLTLTPSILKPKTKKKRKKK